MTDIISIQMKNKILRVIEFCENENIEQFSFTEIPTMSDYSIDFNIDNDFDYWNLEMNIIYNDFMFEEEVREDKYFYFKIEGNEFLPKENEYE